MLPRASQNSSASFISRLAWLLGFCATLFLVAIPPHNAHAAIASVPLFLTFNAQSNILVILDNSNSMDENATGAAVGSNNPNSKSEIARSVIRGLVTSYTGSINMGLMTYLLRNPLNAETHLYDSPYDVSYNPANYDPAFSGARESQTKRFRMPNPTSPGEFIYYNINLPFYAGANNFASFCYSNTAVAFNNGEIPQTNNCNNGPWDTYRCYRTKTGGSDGLPAMDGSNAGDFGYGGGVVFGGNTQFCTTDSDVAQGITDFGRFMTNNYVGRAWYASSSPGRGFLNVPIQALNATQATRLNTQLACNIPGTPAPCTATGIRNAGLTPIQGTLLTARDYFGGSSATWSNATEGYTATVYPLPESCDRDFVVLVTDGLPSTNSTGAAITNTTTAINDAAAAAAALQAAGVKTYVVGFALPFGVDANQLNTIAASGGTTTAYFANDTASLTAALQDIFTVVAASGTAASIATNSTRLDTNTRIYQAKFDSTDWSGQLLAYPIGADGSVGALPAWDTNTAGKIPAHGSRQIYSRVAGANVEFAWTGLTAAQQTALGGFGITENILNWLRGDQSNEQPGGVLRKRSQVLGDIINSNPAYVSAANFGFDSLPTGTAGQGSYAAFQGANKSRPPMLYVGANDGMLHAFDAATGVEKFAFIPPSVLPNLASLSNPGYTHRYFVDGSPQAGDAYLGGGWKTILVGSGGAGTRSIFALDVTNPADFDTVATGKTKVLWEFTDTDLGYPINQFLQPVIGRMQNGDWAVVFGNGYESTNQRAFLYVVNLETGALIKKIDTGVGSAGSPNGLAGPVLLADDNRTITYAYAGDLRGNLWKFDLTGGVGSWDSAFKDGATSKPLFQARYVSGGVEVPQPITAPPEIGKHPQGGYLVIFGTGKYFETGDAALTAKQSVYGIWDKEVANSYITVTDRTSLRKQEILAEPSVNGLNWRVVSRYPLNWASHRGWYVDLLQPPGGTAQGERVVSVPLLRNSRAIFTTLIPSSLPCDAGGTGWIVEVDMVTGGQINDAVLDVNQDSQFSDADKVTVSVDVDGDGVAESVSHVSGIQSTVGIINTPAVIPAGPIEYKYSGGSTGRVMRIIEKGNNDAGRQSWRQLR